MNDQSASEFAFQIVFEGPVIPYYEWLARLFDDIPAAIFIRQLTYWAGLYADPEGWITVKAGEWEQYAYITRRQLDRIRKMLRERKVLEDKVEGMPPTTRYRLNYRVLLPLMQAAAKTPAQNAKLGDGNANTDSMDGGIPPYKDLRKSSPPAHTPAHEEFTDTAFEVPEWLTILRDADPYKPSQAQEATMIANVAKHSITNDRAEDTARDLASQWPYKKHKRIDLTFINWAKGSRNGRGNAGDQLGDVQQRRRPPAKRELVTARRPGRDG